MKSDNPHMAGGEKHHNYTFEVTKNQPQKRWPFTRLIPS